MSWLYILLAVMLGLFTSILILYTLSRRLEKHEPYSSFVRLRMRRKLRFFRLLATDPRVPRRVKAALFLLAGYLALPIDLIPDFIPVLGYVDDVAIILATLAMVVRFTPREVIDDLLSQLAQTGMN